jgi:hypothetical protein
VLTTPNPYYLGRIRDFLLGRSRDSVDHVSLWVPGGIAEMAEREGLRLSRYRGVSLSKARTTLGKAAFRFRPLLCCLPAGEDLLCSTLIFECVREEAATQRSLPHDE